MWHPQVSVPFVSLVSEEDFLRAKGFSSCVISTLVIIRKPVRRAIYIQVWKVFNAWLFRLGLGSRGSQRSLSILQEAVEMGLAVSTLKVKVAALSFFFFGMFRGGTTFW